MLAGIFQGASFIKIMSYIPFFSALLSPALLILGQITIVDVLLSIIFMIITICLIIRYGIRIYKAGILNYSNEKIWGRVTQVIRNRDV